MEAMRLLVAGRSVRLLPHWRTFILRRLFKSSEPLSMATQAGRPDLDAKHRCQHRKCICIYFFRGKSEHTSVGKEGAWRAMSRLPEGLWAKSEMSIFPVERCKTSGLKKRRATTKFLPETNLRKLYECVHRLSSCGGNCFISGWTFVDSANGRTLELDGGLDGAADRNPICYLKRKWPLKFDFICTALPLANRFKLLRLTTDSGPPHLRLTGCCWFMCRNMFVHFYLFIYLYFLLFNF